MLMKRTRAGVTLLALLAVTAVVLIAFGLMSAPGRTESVTGQVVSVERGSVTTISSLTLEDDSGTRWHFAGASTFAGFTPSHLEQHGVLREPVTVEYERTADGRLKILTVSD